MELWEVNFWETSVKVGLLFVYKINVLANKGRCEFIYRDLLGVQLAYRIQVKV